VKATLGKRIILNRKESKLVKECKVERKWGARRWSLVRKEKF
jgi:hypothetical protein